MYVVLFSIRCLIGLAIRGYAIRRTSVKRRKKQTCTQPRRQPVSSFANERRVFLHEFVLLKANANSEPRN